MEVSVRRARLLFSNQVTPLDQSVHFFLPTIYICYPHLPTIRPWQTDSTVMEGILPNPLSSCSFLIKSHSRIEFCNHVKEHSNVTQCVKGVRFILSLQPCFQAMLLYVMGLVTYYRHYTCWISPSNPMASRLP